MAGDEAVRGWLALLALERVGVVRSVALARRFGGPERVLAATEDELRRARMPPAVARAIRGFRDWAAVDREIEAARRAGAEIICHGDPAYPVSLRWTADPPPVLYVRGRLVREDLAAIAVVGSRAASAYGLAAAETIARDLAAAGVTVVSGLAVGIDSAAHRGALAGGGRTIAVLGSGIDVVYPRTHLRLAAEIAERGAVVSEFPIGARPESWHFPRRNRIVAGLALGVVVVEAGEKSGSLITARMALSEGREVCAVPGEIGLGRTRGTHRLLREGAHLVESGAEVIAEVMPFFAASAAKNVPPADSGLAPEASRLLASFENGAVVAVDRLIEKSGLAPGRVLELLLELELAGRVRQHPGMAFSRTA